MTAANMKATNTAVRRCVTLVLQSPGMSAADIAAALNLSPTYLAQVLQVARTSGQIRPVLIEAHVFGWYQAGQIADAAEVEMRAKFRDRDRERNNVAHRRRRGCNASEPVGRQLAPKPVVVTRPAAEVKPIRPAAPASVFNLGSML